MSNTEDPISKGAWFVRIVLVMVFAALAFVMYTVNDRDTIGSVEFSHAQQMCLGFDGLQSLTTSARRADSILLEARCSNDTLVTKRVSL